MNSGTATNARRDPPDDDLLRIVYEEYVKNVDQVLVHLRDARNILYSIRELDGNRALSKAVVLLASASLESNLAYISSVALQFARTRPQRFGVPHVLYLRGVDEEIDDNGRIVEKKARQSLADRMQIVPNLVARAIDRNFTMPRNRAYVKKLQRTIARRDAIIHPKWDRYIAELGWWEAAEAVDAVELYLESIYQCLHPYMLGYAPMLWTIKGPSPDDVGVGYRTQGKRAPKRTIGTMSNRSIAELLLEDWLDSTFMIELAFGHDTEADSDGSMLTRAALVLLYAMLDAQLAVVSQWKMQENGNAFRTAEALFLNEVAVGIGHDGEVWIGAEQHTFKRRIKAIPAVLARCVEGKDYFIDLGTSWARDLMQGQALRNKVVHSRSGERIPRVSKDELKVAVAAVHQYLSVLANDIPDVFGHMTLYLDGGPGRSG